jgi:hypothetical protein
MVRKIIGLGATALALVGCAGGGTNNQGAAQNAANAAVTANAAAPAREEAPTLALDQQRLVDTCIPQADRTRSIDQLGAARRAALNLCLNNETARQLDARLPIRIDASTLLDRVTVEGPALVYRYRIDKRVAELPAGTPDRLDAMTRRSACAGEDVQQIIALGGVQIYRWVDRDEAPIREVRIARC